MERSDIRGARASDPGFRFAQSRLRDWHCDLDVEIFVHLGALPGIKHDRGGLFLYDGRALHAHARKQIFAPPYRHVAGVRCAEISSSFRARVCLCVFNMSELLASRPWHRSNRSDLEIHDLDRFRLGHMAISPLMRGVEARDQILDVRRLRKGCEIDAHLIRLPAIAHSGLTPGGHAREASLVPHVGDKEAIGAESAGVARDEYPGDPDLGGNATCNRRSHSAERHAREVARSLAGAD